MTKDIMMYRFKKNIEYNQLNLKEYIINTNKFTF